MRSSHISSPGPSELAPRERRSSRCSLGGVRAARAWFNGRAVNNQKVTWCFNLTKVGETRLPRPLARQRGGGKLLPILLAMMLGSSLGQPAKAEGVRNERSNDRGNCYFTFNKNSQGFFKNDPPHSFAKVGLSNRSPKNCGAASGTDADSCLFLGEETWAKNKQAPR